ncbi:MAG: thiosulfate oxidation carrier complex protein SoxZ [Pseudomonadota bacterium]
MDAVNSMKIRAKLTADIAEIKLIISHPMETGRKKDDFDQLIPAHFIQLLSITLNDKPVLEAQWGTGIAKNPYLTFKVKGAKVGDKVTVTWLDNLGESGTQDALVIQS